MSRLIDVNDYGPYTVRGFSLQECPLEDLEIEANAGRRLKADGWAGSYRKLDAIEAELLRRKA
jgi:hypothetical protein